MSVCLRVFRQAILENEFPEAAYWHIAPKLHRHWRHVRPGYVGPSINPFKLVLVDPNRIVQFSTREWPIWRNKFQTFGAVLDGDWDRRDIPPVRPYNGPDLSLYFADRFTETPLHEAMEAHFIDGIPWEKTTFVQRVLQQARDGGRNQSVWHKCSTTIEIRERCQFLDRLYADMCRRGCLSARRLNVENGRPDTFSGVMRNEILVDIGRDGELLFVTGRHRLSIAKILGLERIPIAIAVRHAQWLDQRETLIDHGPSIDRGEHQRRIHPDLRHEFGMESIDVSW